MNEPIHFCISALLLWIAWYYAWKPFWLDYIRQNLFKLRDDLFLMVAKKEIALDFDSKEYGLVRNYFNSSIRHSHSVNFPKVFMLLTLNRLGKINLKDFKSSFERALETIQDSATKEKLIGLHKKAAIYSAMYTALTSPTLILALIGLPFLLIGIIIYRRSLNRISKMLFVDIIVEKLQSPVKAIDMEAETGLA